MQIESESSSMGETENISESTQKRELRMLRSCRSKVGVTATVRTGADWTVLVPHTNHKCLIMGPGCLQQGIAIRLCRQAARLCIDESSRAGCFDLKANRN